MTLTEDFAQQPGLDAARVDLRSPRSGPDQIFRMGLIACASTALVVIVGIVYFLAKQALLSWNIFHLHLFTDAYSQTSRTFGILPDLVGSVVIALVALSFAAPIALSTSLAINEYVPRSVRAPLVSLVDLLAALPSLVYGLWGVQILDHQLHGTSLWLGRHANFIPIFRLDGPQIGGGLFEAGIVVAIMVLPLMTSISREVMSQVPRIDCEAALALGGTRWGMITDVILPFSRNGIVGGAMLALGRALGETIAVSLILHNNSRITGHLLQGGGGAIAPHIVTNFQGSSALEKSALTFAGLTLFAVTLGINIGARVVLSQARKAGGR